LLQLVAINHLALAWSNIGVHDAIALGLRAQKNDAGKQTGNGKHRVIWVCRDATYPASLSMEEKPPYKPGVQIYADPPEHQQPASSFGQGAILIPWSLQLIAYARQINAEGQHSFAVVLAHAACEWAMEDALRRLLSNKGVADDIAEPILRVLTTTSLTDKRVRQLFTGMTGRHPREQKWWKDWEASRNLRQRVAHRGLAVTPEQALDALSLSESYVRYIATAVGKVIGITAGR
jgi:hypothetical protein